MICDCMCIYKVFLVFLVFTSLKTKHLNRVFKKFYLPDVSSVSGTSSEPIYNFLMLFSNSILYFTNCVNIYITLFAVMHLFCN